jgi:WD40 repeat protein
MKLKLGKAIHALAFSPDGKTLAAASGASRVTLVNPVTGRLREVKGHSATVRALAFSPDARLLASGDERGLLLLSDVRTGATVRRLAGPAGGVLSLAFAPDGKTLAVAGGGTEAVLYDPATGLKRELGGARLLETITFVAFAPDGQRVVLAGRQARKGGRSRNVLSLLDLRTGKLFTATGPDRPPGGAGGTIASFSPDGKSLAWAPGDGSVRVLQVPGGRELVSLTGHRGELTALLYLRDGRTLVSAGEDGSLRFWELPRGRERARLNEGRVLALALAPDNRALASGDADGILRVRDVRELLKAREAPGAEAAPDP